MYQLLKCTVQRFIAKDTFTMGAALAYYTAFSLAPLLIIAVAVAGFVFGAQAAEGRLSAEIQDSLGPTIAKAVEEMVKNARESGDGPTASVIGLIALLFGAGGVFGQLQTSLNAVWDVPPSATGGLWYFIRSRFLSFAMVLGIGFLLLVSLVISTAISALGKTLPTGTALVAQTINQVVSFAFVTVLFAAIYRILPDRHIAWRDVWLGAAFTAVLFSVGKYLIGLYLGKGSAASAFGAAGSLALVLLWVYYASQILLFGAQFTYVQAMRRTDPSWTCDRDSQPERVSDQATRRAAEREPAHT
jgi:membrane protein